MVADYIDKPDLWSEIQMATTTTGAEIEAVFGAGSSLISYDTSNEEWWTLYVLYGGQQFYYSGTYGSYLRAKRSPSGEQRIGQAWTSDVPLASDPNVQPA